MFTFITLILWITSLVALYIEYGVGWLVLLVLTTFILVIRGVIFMGFDFDDLF